MMRQTDVICVTESQYKCHISARIAVKSVTYPVETMGFRLDGA